MTLAPPAGSAIAISADPTSAARIEAALRDLAGWRVTVCRPRELRERLEDDPRTVAVVAGPAADVRRLLRALPAGARAIALSDDPASLWTPAARSLGLRAALSLRASDAELVAAVRAVHAGLYAVHADVLAAPGRAAADAVGAPLTSREREILELLAEGASNRAIAARLRISRHTAKFHVASILAKLGAASRTEAVALALRAGLLAV